MVTFSIAAIILLTFRLVYRNQIFIFLFDFIGTFFHELAHFTIGLFMMAQPINFSIFPKNENGQLVLGSVGFLNVRFFNAIPIGLAPLVLLIPIMYIPYYVYNNDLSILLSILLSLVFISLSFSFLPSSQDYKVAFSNIFGVLFYIAIFSFIILYFFFPEIYEKIVLQIKEVIYV